MKKNFYHKLLSAGALLMFCVPAFCHATAGETFDEVNGSFSNSGVVCRPYYPEAASATIQTPLQAPVISSISAGTSVINLKVSNENAGASTQLFRALSFNSEYELIDTNPPGDENFTDDNLTPGVTYSYKVRATGSNGESTFSTSRGVTTLDVAGWYPPGFMLLATSPETIEIHLTDKSYQDDRYEVFTDHYELTFREEVIMSDSGRTVVLSTSNAQPGLIYDFHLEVFFNEDDGYNPHHVATASVIMPYAKPEISVSHRGAEVITLNISNPNSGTSTRLYRSASRDSGYEIIGELPGFYETMEDRGNGLLPGTTYYYKAGIGGSNDVYSDVLEVSTLTLHYPNLTATAIDGTTVELTLTDNSSVESEYQIIGYSSSGHHFEQRVSMTDSGRMETFIHNQLDPGIQYNYLVDMYLNNEEGNNYYEEVFYEVAVASVTTPGMQPCENKGSIAHEVWNNIPGTNVSAIPVDSPPSAVTILTRFETPSNAGSNYGARVRGYICPPVGGYFTFWIASDDKSELWLSTDDSPGNKILIASVTGHTGVRQWDRYATQRSTPVYLQYGRRYYIEALHKEAAGGDHLAVGWQLPNGNFERPIEGESLIRFEAETPVACEGNGSITWDVWHDQTGTTIDYTTLRTMPDATTSLSNFESPQYYGNNYLSRASGYVCVPQSGEYTFWIASDDKSDLWLSTDEDPDNKIKIASVTNYAPYGNWEKYTTQRSAPVYLAAGSKYYIEAVHKEGTGADYVAVGWQMPDGTMERPIQGNHLVPYIHSVTLNCSEGNDGHLVREIWRNISGTSVGSIPVNTEPDDDEQITTFETGTYFANDYGSRIRGYVCIPTTGSYVFWIASDDNSELWLSTDASEENKVKIASVTGATRVREWTKYLTQESVPITLQAGYKYYIEVLHKEANGNDHVAVGWQLPDETLERPIPANRLIPFNAGSDMAAAGRVSAEESDALSAGEDKDNVISLSPNPVTDHHVRIGVLHGEPVSLHLAHVKVMSLTGEIVHTEIIKCTTGDCSDAVLTLNNDTPPGIYVVNVVSQGRLWLKKMIVE